ncbi:unnamed protein product [Psylliodes chrysocephalus]|uniref:gamma-glutamylcyclotransferase n=1 Tax=Psylliodes chrysocephalus TaxID=3402493 RepID=A0A9P0D2N6_9CUCU|nr:unnamed protein product [Psylliodes chrysocephala]
MSSNCICYFAYGSNLLAKRMHLLNPNAVRYGKAILKDYSLTFGGYASFWGGSPADIKHKVGHNVWGALWEIKLDDLSNLDEQEGVHENFYYPLSVEIETSNGTKLKCRTYQQVQRFEYINLTKLPDVRKPSKSYLNTIIKGAEETGLPTDYLHFLKAIPTNDSEIIPEFLKC